MKLRELIDNLESADDSLCIVATRPWSSESESLLVRVTHALQVPDDVLAQGYEYFLEVSVALDEVLDGVTETLSTEQRRSALLFYAEHDAPPEWLCTLRGQLGSQA